MAYKSSVPLQNKIKNRMAVMTVMVVITADDDGSGKHRRKKKKKRTDIRESSPPPTPPRKSFIESGGKERCELDVSEDSNGVKENIYMYTYVSYSIPGIY